MNASDASKLILALILVATVGCSPAPIRATSPDDAGASLPASRDAGCQSCEPEDAGAGVDGGHPDGGSEFDGGVDAGNPDIDGGIDAGPALPLCPDRAECRVGVDGGQPYFLKTAEAVAENDEVHSLALPDGTSILSGQYYGTAEIMGVPLPDPAGGGVGWNVYVARIDSSRAVLWVKSYGEQARSVYVRAVVRFNDTLVLGLTSVDDSDNRAELLDVSLDGEVSPPINVGQGRTGYLKTLAVSSEGLVFSGEYFGTGWEVAGRPVSGIDASTGDPRWFGFVTSWSPESGLRWVQTEEMEDSDPSWAANAVKQIAVAPDGTIYWAHSFVPQVIEAFEPIAGQRIFRTTLAGTPAGPLMWAIAATPESTVIVAAPFDARGAPFVIAGKELHSLTDSDMYIAELGKDGVGKWARSFSGNQAVWAVAVSAEGEIVVSGVTYARTGDFGSGAIRGDNYVNTFVAAYARTGDPLWSRFLGGALVGKPYPGGYDPYDGYVLPIELAPLSDGTLQLSGNYWGSVNFGIGDELAHEWTSAFVLKFNG